MLEISIAAIGIMAASLIGIVFVDKTAARFLERKLSLLVSFSTGVFIVTAALLAVEVFHIMDSYGQAISFIVVGYGLATILQYLLPESHHHHDEDCLHKNSAKKIIVGDGIHNITDGIILVSAFTVSTTLGIAVAVSIFIHEALQEISEFFMLRRAGYSVRKSLAINLFVSSTIFIGIVIGWLSLSTELLEGVLLAISCGFFLHVLIHDLVPHTKQAGDQYKGALLLLLLGILLMLGVSAALGETHTHGDNKNHEDHNSDTDHYKELPDDDHTH